MTDEPQVWGSTREDRHARALARQQREENRPKRMAISHKRRKILRYIRLGLVMFGLYALYSIQSNFDFVRLPEEGCRPILAYEPGITLLVSIDPAAKDLVLGDIVMFTLDSGQISYGRLSTPPGLEAGQLLTESGYWIVGDNPDCPADDSISLGSIAPERIAGRVLFPLRF
ncbi:MAG: S24/S26 family peptidase [Planctomycetota bacterium]|jgi:hypothetical protein|nr:S24/S26 family peptidase [Planctomycetota bacterium]MDG2143451.1 S24/S26 family peptidase [Planctomycetota bacterium]